MLPRRDPLIDGPAKPMSVSMTAELEAYIEALAARFGFDQSRQWSRFVRLLIVAGGRQLEAEAAKRPDSRRRWKRT